MKHSSMSADQLRKTLSIDCAGCQGLCCQELFFSKSDGFPSDKPAGEPCSYLMPDFRCGIHSQLEARGMKGCIAYDCFGAGQAASWSGEDFHRMFRLRQMLWYLLEAEDHAADEAMRRQIHQLIRMQNPEAGQDRIKDIEAYQDEVNGILKRLIKRHCRKGRPQRQDMSGMDFREKDLCQTDFTFTFLIAANLSGCKLDGTSLLGADLRDARLHGADLSRSLFLTQGQINGAGGNGETKLPSYLSPPESWKSQRK